MEKEHLETPANTGLAYAPATKHKTRPRAGFFAFGAPDLNLIRGPQVLRTAGVAP
jgi:hypothetical protein